ncbi:MAG: DUF1330 domain-containing protein [Aquamicrobium sp.]|uniref:DUF1330 domain-containing protein n=1 Tax=Aquamicrobium sp. TaxID=1872579 RepID=UPI00349E5E66|nr:DUF1330 domain-containing protein [Aquamicrobium sp.]
MSKKGYWIALVDVTDPEAYKDYVAANAVAFEKYGAKFVVRAGRNEQPAEPAGTRHVVIEFDSYDRAVECYHSPEYKAAVEFRKNAAKARLVIVEGV